ncbi:MULTISPECIES: helix-turn-helix transcriptional regulator [unclassified Crossiella]|uniref:helix-turn-helix domain-containing protein n=1 Tax=unclassified Crossiella TaxID=2620835 RepID=UPI001FFFEB52|nr:MULTISPECIES: helix-turn-helix transcriptional regulator [unclassified Crossiella]MCK2245216.1 helix-turn-helix transcriptional regulator [Crossiella sp. S99.2]MCK2258862.1 helix-turn-helix transcriptional regulator [Crossiella sp. S99.1]
MSHPTEAFALPEILARRRMTLNMSQQELADKTALTKDTISRIERGVRSPRPDTITKLAAGVGLSRSALLGLPPTPRASQADDATRLRDLRRAITFGAVPCLDEFPETYEVTAPDVLIASTHQAWQDYVAGRNGELLATLPILLIDAHRLEHATTGHANAEAHRVLSTTRRLAAGLAGRLKLDDLAWTAAMRALEAAGESDSPETETAISTRYLVWTHVRLKQTTEAERLALAAAARIEPRMLDRDPVRAGIFGNLLFNGASAASREGNHRQAQDVLAVAEAAAIRSGTDMVSEAAIFGPRVSAIQQVDHALRRGDPESALRLASRIPASTGQVPAFWEAGHYLHCAAAAVQLGQDQLALRFLAQAQEIAPDWSRQQPLGMSTMYTLLGRAAKKPGGLFAALAAYYGIADELVR